MQEYEEKYSCILILRRVRILVTAAMLCLCCSSVVLADKKKEPELEEFYNPLEITTPDPLLPYSVEERPLTPLERLRLTAALEQLNQQAAAKLAAGDRLGAFEIWNRELRLRRSLGYLEEVKALSRVGAIAWSENQRLEVQVITQRLQEIQQQTKLQPEIDLQLLQSLGVAFEQVRSLKPAIEVYQQILAAARQRQDQVAVEATLKTIAELHLSWFEYPQAAASYEELLSLARAKSDRASEITYLQDLAYVYRQANNPQKAVEVREKLAEFYLNEDQFTQIPALRIAIGGDYESLGQLKNAFQNYQEAYASAWSLGQYARAGSALRNLIALYRSQKQIDAALETSKILLEADQLATNVYGMMTTYDQIGQIYLERTNYSEALAAFQKGLELAKQLNYQEDYFTKQIEQANQQLAK